MDRFIVTQCRHCLLKGIELYRENAFEVCKHPQCALSETRQRVIENSNYVPGWCPLRSGETVIDLAMGIRDEMTISD